MPDHASTGHQVAFVRGVDEDLGGMHAAGCPQADDAGACFLDAFQRLFGQDLHAGLLEHRICHAGGDMRLIGPDRIIFLRHIVREFHPAGGVVGGDSLMPFFEESQ